MHPFEPQNLPPKNLDFLSLMPLMGKANRSIALLEGLFHGIPNPDVLLSPFTTQEAVLSSKIEGTQADFEAVLKFEAGESPDEPSRQEDIHEIINYRKALRLSEELLKNRPFCLNTLLHLHSVLMDSVRGHNKGRGHFRRIQNWIGKPGSKIEEADFIPPSPLHLLDHMNRWEAYWHSDAPDVIVQLAIIHAQFEILHPFIDGNGRLGRMLIPLFIYEKKILSRPCFYLSAFFETHRDEYISHLRYLGQPGSWSRWCAFFLRGVAIQAEQNTNKARAILNLYEDLKKRIIDITHSRHAIPLLDFMFEKPIFQGSEIAKLPNMPSAQTVAQMLRQLKANRILRTLREGSGRRPTILAMPELINLCEGKKIL
jgi:Fic family protein